MARFFSKLGTNVKSPQMVSLRLFAKSYPDEGIINRNLLITTNHKYTEGDRQVFFQTLKENCRPSPLDNFARSMTRAKIEKRNT